MFSLQGKDASKPAGNWFQLLMVLFTKEYLFIFPCETFIPLIRLRSRVLLKCSRIAAQSLSHYCLFLNVRYSTLFSFLSGKQHNWHTNSRRGEEIQCEVPLTLCILSAWPLICATSKPCCRLLKRMGKHSFV